MKIRRRLGVLGATAAVALLDLIGPGIGVSEATYSTNCWAYQGGDRAYGGCTGAGADGTWFRIGQRCGRTLAVRVSPLTYAPPGRAVSAVTDNCKWYDGGGTRAAFIYENY